MEEIGNYWQMLDIEAVLNGWEAAVLAELVQGKEVVGCVLV